MFAKDTKHADSVKERNVRVSQVLNSPMNEKDGAASGRCSKE